MDGLMEGIGGQMKTFCKLTAQSPAASYVPLPRSDYPKKAGLGKPALITLNYPADAKLIQPKEDGAISRK